MKTKEQVIRCERCNEILKIEQAVWLELSMTDGRYYKNIPNGHESQGGFSFGKTCAKRELSQK
jgi:hypothetical protein